MRNTTDMLTGTACIRRGLTLLHNDGDIEAMEPDPGLRAMNLRPQ